MKIKLNITQEIINKSDPRSMSYCPIAIALRNVLKKDEYNLTPSVNVGRVITAPSLNLKVRMPAPGWEFLGRIDAHKSLSPFSFYINIPQRCLARKRYRHRPRHGSL